MVNFCHKGEPLSKKPLVLPLARIEWNSVTSTDGYTAKANLQFLRQTGDLNLILLIFFNIGASYLSLIMTWFSLL